MSDPICEWNESHAGVNVYISRQAGYLRQLEYYHLPSGDTAGCHWVSTLNAAPLEREKYLFRDRQRGLVVSPLAVDILE